MSIKSCTELLVKCDYTWVMLRLALVQMLVGSDKSANLKRACDLVSRAKGEHSADLVCLPECFNSPYGTSYFGSYAEPVPGGSSCQMMASAARDNNVWLVAGSMPEISPDGKLYNCSVTFSPNGEFVGAYRKMHLFDIDIPGQFTFRESATLSAGKDLLTFTIPFSNPTSSTNRTETKVLRVGVGICYDVRFPELSLVYANQLNCQLLLFPGAFNHKTGPLHWELLARARSLDTQCFVGMCSPACDLEADYISHAESLITNPWGVVLAKAGKEETIVTAELNLADLKIVRESIPISHQRRLDIYSLPKLIRKQN